jgi:alkanesulfonate monooxygenase SsuD/methylene tetrahydromethanopterin reductase-like flavin-dependent oxidoreductase (luciferase family)
MYQLSVNIGPGQGGLDLERLQARLRAAEEGGIHSIWTGEAWGPDAITQLALAAAYTKRVLLGSAIVNVYSRTPAAIAQHFATLDIVSGGRMLLGLGTSGANVVEHFHGVPFGRGVRRLREYIDIINMLLAAQPLNYEGEIFRMRRGFTLRFQTLRPHIPILIASLNPASVRMTARHADGWLPIWMPVERLADEIAAFRATASKAGRDPAALLVRAPGAITLTRDVERSRQTARGQIAFYIARMGVFYHQHIGRLCGDELVARVKRAFDEGGSAAGTAAVPDELADAMTLVTDSIEQARERLAQQQAAAVDLHQVSVEEREPSEQAKVYEALAG